jgi:hypothetical protein
MIYVLIVILYGDGAVRSLTMHDFYTLAQCQYAAQTIKKAASHVEAAYCVEKGMVK